MLLNGCNGETLRTLNRSIESVRLVRSETGFVRESWGQAGMRI